MLEFAHYVQKTYNFGRKRLPGKLKVMAGTAAEKEMAEKEKTEKKDLSKKDTRKKKDTQKKKDKDTPKKKGKDIQKKKEGKENQVSVADLASATALP